jgi:hypothetical protein
MTAVFWARSTKPFATWWGSVAERVHYCLAAAGRMLAEVSCLLSFCGRRGHHLQLTSCRWLVMDRQGRPVSAAPRRWGVTRLLPVGGGSLPKSSD